MACTGPGCADLCVLAAILRRCLIRLDVGHIQILGEFNICGFHIAARVIVHGEGKLQIFSWHLECLHVTDRLCSGGCVHRKEKDIPGKFGRCSSGGRSGKLLQFSEATKEASLAHPSAFLNCKLGSS